MTAAILCAAVLLGSLNLHPLDAAKAWAQQQLGVVQWRCLDALVRRESGWRVDAVNRHSGAFGLFQAYPASKLDRWGRDPMGQMRFGLAYIGARYGSPCRALRHDIEAGWY